MGAVVALLGGARATAFAALCLALLAFAGWQTIRLSRAQTTIANMAARSVAEQFATSEAYRKEEQTRARYIAGVGEAYERGKRDAQAKGDKVAAALRNGSLRFKRLWEGCAAAAAAVPGAGADPGQPDAAAAGRADSAGRIVRAVAQDAAQIRCLQALALIDRGMDPGDLSKGCPAP